MFGSDGVYFDWRECILFEWSVFCLDMVYFDWSVF